MKVIVTGHEGYIGSVLTAVLHARGHQVRGLDNGLFRDCDFMPQWTRTESFDVDLRDLRVEYLTGYDAVIHLAALSNDPLSDFDPALTYDINYRQSVRLAYLAKLAGITRFVYSSSCSIYGAAKEDMLNEESPVNPLTAYGVTKNLAERDIAVLADDTFSPTFLRNATVFGASPRLRLDLVVNDLVAHAHATNEIKIKSDGAAWRPLIHVRDLAWFMALVIEAPRHAVHNECFNVGDTKHNYTIRDIATAIEKVRPKATVTFAPAANKDLLSYRIDCGKLRRVFPDFRGSFDLQAGIHELFDAYERHGLSKADLDGDRYFRLQHIKRRQARREFDDSLKRVRARSA